MLKSLALQAEMTAEFGVCVFDVTLDCEDGAAVGGELDHANMVAALSVQALAAPNLIAKWHAPRIGVRVHAVQHQAFASDIDTIVGAVGHLLSYVMVPKVESLSDVEMAANAIDAALPVEGTELPIHVLLESPLAIHRAFEIAAHPRVESISFGLMDFVSSHAGAIPDCAMGFGVNAGRPELDQFHHPLVTRAKAEVASACHANGKVPSHCVVTQFDDLVALEVAARTAADAWGFTRMWSIHPSQIRPILKAFAPRNSDIDKALEVISKAQAQDWAPIALDGQLHDRASYRYYWNVLERAHQTGVALPDSATQYFSQ